MKFCTSCGSQLEDSVSFCTSCGATQAAPINRNISRDEYLNTYADPKLKKEIKSCVIICYVLLALNFVVGIVVSVVNSYVNWMTLIDLIIYGGLTLGIHLKKSKGCAIALLVISALSTVITFIITHTVSGYLWIIVAIFAIVNIGKLNKAYAQYKSGATITLADNVK